MFLPFAKSHMPFVIQEDNKKTIFFCLFSDYGRWRLHYLTEDGEVHRVNTGLPEYFNECSPVASTKTGDTLVSFIGAPVLEASTERNGLYRININTGKLLRICDCTVGFLREDMRVLSDWSGDPISILTPDGLFRLKLPTVTELFRICPMYSDANILLITAKLEGILHSLKFDILTGDCVAVTTSAGDPLYKFCEYGNGGYLYAVRNSEGGFEDRSIMAADTALTTQVTGLVTIEKMAATINEDPYVCLSSSLWAAVEHAKDLMSFEGLTIERASFFRDTMTMALLSATALGFDVFVNRLTELLSQFNTYLTIPADFFSVVYSLTDTLEHVERPALLSDRDIEVKQAFAGLKQDSVSQEIP